MSEKPFNRLVAIGLVPQIPFKQSQFPFEKRILMQDCKIASSSMHDTRRQSNFVVLSTGLCLCSFRGYAVYSGYIILQYCVRV